MRYSEKRSIQVAMIAVLAGVATGCGTARLVRSSPGKGGEVALQGLRDKAQEQANGMMQQVCGTKSPEIVEEGEAVIGSTTTENGSSSLDPWRKNQTTRTSNTSESTQKTEWRIKFECRAENEKKDRT